MSERPNIVFIQSDQHAARLAGCYGDTLVSTPNLDRLAASGVTFDAAYCPAPICVPSRMSQLTGRHPFRQNCWHNSDYLPSDLPTFAHSLGAAGYQPVLVGRLHSNGPDQHRGYARRLVGDHHPNWPSKASHSLGPLGQAQLASRASLINSGAGQCSYELHDIAVAEAACAHLEAIAAERKNGASAPFMMTVGFMLPHNPYVAHPDDFARYAGRVPAPRLSAPDDEHPHIRWWREFTGAHEAGHDEVMRARAAYYALVDKLDSLVGMIIDRLRDLGLDRNTMVVYASDHGEHAGERGLFWKSTFYEESVRVPLIISWPGVLPAGERRKHVVNLVDLTATIVQAGRAPSLPNADGCSLLGIAADPARPWDDTTFSEYCSDGFLTRLGGKPQFSRMVRSGRYKLIYYHGYPPQLFDLETDPLEQSDLAAQPRYAELREALIARVLAGWNPESIWAYMHARNRDKALLSEWQETMRPESTHVWPMRAEQNWLAGAESGK